MKLAIRWVCIYCFFSLLLFPLVGYPQERTNYCAVCHGEKQVAFAESLHAARGMGCVDCHGGDPEAIESADAKLPSTGFKGDVEDDTPSLSKKEIVELCASCHADYRKMRQYGIPTHQLEEYRNSQHGQALFQKGDENVAVCTDCHGSHRILPPTDPRSLTYKLNIPKVCAKCHSDPELMKPYGLSDDAFEQYKGSVHGQALLEKGSQTAPECAGCHGTHGATPPGVTEVGNVCGQCHSNARDHFNRSPHKKPMDEGRMGECTSCHGNHATSVTSVALFDAMCQKCHEVGSGSFRRGQKLRAMLVAARGAFEDAYGEIEKAKLKGLYVDDYQMALDEANTEIIQAMSVQHTLSLEQVERYTRRAQATSDDVKLEVHETLQELKLRKFGLGIVWLFVFFVLSVLYLKRRRLTRG